MKLFVSLLVGFLTLAVSVFAAIRVHSPEVGVAIAVTLGVFWLLADIRVNQSKRTIEVDPLTAVYRRLKQSKCPLVREMADSKYSESIAFFENLSEGRIFVADDDEVHQILQLLFCKLGIVKAIHATSYGELGEWGHPNSFWAKTYPELNRKAAEQGKRVERIFIMQPGEQSERTDEIFRQHMALKVSVKTAQQRLVPAPDFNQANNCLIFFDKRKRPIYCFQAMHDREGRFAGAVLFSKIENIQPIVDSYDRIDAVAQVYA